ncbi:hypothetical protein BB560_005559 [Smittium megazygosporum]|uniref:Prefoldin, alpha subunit n=1 Tax=Smittium megazygosporum TaxID=133381 RepID=A0A2T9Z3E0_9FUNG|nr:hypothetical protein BB560_005559 [Smittium megazygosporum]
MSSLAPVSNQSSSETPVPDSIFKYTNHIETVLVPKLKNLAEKRDKIYNSISEFLKLKSIIETIEEHSLQNLKLQVDLGSNFYVFGRAPSTEFFYVNIGLGNHLKMSRSEAVKFIDKKQAHLERLADNYSLEINNTRATIKVMREAISELMGLSANSQ